MKIHLAGAHSFKEVILKHRVPNILLSFIDMKDKEDLGSWLMQTTNARRIMVDSGAFSVWSVGREIDINEYVAFCKRLSGMNLPYEFVYVALDVIPGTKGVMPTERDREISAQRSWENALYMQSQGVSPLLPVFHQYEDFRWLDRYQRTFPYFGVATVKNRFLTYKAKMGFLDNVFLRIRGSCKTHGFGITSREMLFRYPFYSVDSTSWIDPKKYGHSLTTNLKVRGLKRTKNQKICAKSGGHGRVMLWELDNEIRRWIEMEKLITRLWRERGVSWDGEN